MSQYFATAPKGIETVTADELKRLGAKNVEPTVGGVAFEADTKLLYEACLWLRTPNRILMPLREFAAKTPEMLYDQVRRVKWEQYLNPEKTFSVECTIAGQGALNKDKPVLEEDQPREKRGLHHSHFVALKIKDSIVDQLRTKYGSRPNVDKHNPDLRIFAYLRDGRCTLSIDVAGRSLHERGYRMEGAGAPMKENLAAAIIELSGWDGKSPFLDPMCGSGTLVLEAALKAMNIAPGLFNPEFGFMRLPDFDKNLWSEILTKTQDAALFKRPTELVGYDNNHGVVAAALQNAQRAGLQKIVHFEKRELSELQPIGQKPGVMIVNPPYGERLGTDDELPALYKLIGDLMKQRMKGWTGYIFTGNLELAKSVGLRAAKRIPLYNGPIECRLLKYELY